MLNQPLTNTRTQSVLPDIPGIWVTIEGRRGKETGRRERVRGKKGQAKTGRKGHTRMHAPHTHHVRARAHTTWKEMSGAWHQLKFTTQRRLTRVPSQRFGWLITDLITRTLFCFGVAIRLAAWRVSLTCQREGSRFFFPGSSYSSPSPLPPAASTPRPCSAPTSIAAS